MLTLGPRVVSHGLCFATWRRSFWDGSFPSGRRVIARDGTVTCIRRSDGSYGRKGAMPPP